MTDQYGEQVPDDLVVLDIDPSDLIREEREKIVNARWYEARNILLVSLSEIGGLTETDPADAGIELDKDEIFYVDDILKRYNPIDGFYHA
jgi:hypothetical protein